MKATALTKTEQKILDAVRAANDVGALAGLQDDKYTKRLAEAGRIVYVKLAPRMGAGWAIAGHELAK